MPPEIVTPFQKREAEKKSTRVLLEQVPFLKRGRTRKFGFIFNWDKYERNIYLPSGSFEDF